MAVPPSVSLKVNVVPMQWTQCPTMCMQHFVMEDAVPMKVDAVIRQWLHCTVLCA